MSLNEFRLYALAKKQIEYHSFNPNAKFQCTDLANDYILKVWKLATIIGTNAKDFPERLSPGMEFIKNAVDYLPEAGELAVWNGQVGGGAGHISVVLKKGLQATFQSLDQNWSKPLFITQEKHSYTNVRGFIRKLQSTPEPMPETNIVELLSYYKVKSTDELRTMVDTQLAFLEEARKRNTEVESINRDHVTHLEELATKLNTTADYPAILAETIHLLGVEELNKKLDKQLHDEEIKHDKEVNKLIDDISVLRAAVERQQSENKTLLTRLEALEQSASQQQEKQETISLFKNFVNQLTKLFERKK